MMNKYCIVKNGKTDIEEFYEDLKSFGITEIRERIYLDLSIECMHKHRYVKDRSNEYCLYYVMQ